MIAVLVLAAGSSRRLGEAKQLLRLDGVSLVERAVDRAASLGPVLVVTGAQADAVRGAVGGSAHCVHNPHFEEGMGSSLRVGLAAALTAHPGLTGVVVTTCDQPWVSRVHLQALASGLALMPIAASAYDGVLGVPAAFARPLFAELGEAVGDRGARDTIRRDPSRVLAVPCADAARDVDRPGDLAP